MFAGSCVGVICLVILLEFLRRLQREYDQFTRRINSQSAIDSTNDQHPPKSVHVNGSNTDQKDEAIYSGGEVSNDSNREIQIVPPSTPLLSTFSLAPPARVLTRHRGNKRHTPSVAQHLVRSAIYTCQFAVAYMVMLLAMYYNGYILICIFIGAFLGNFIWGWDLGSISGARR